MQVCREKSFALEHLVLDTWRRERVHLRVAGVG